ncbi:MAG: acyl-CoA dehydrogenase family protein [Kouleothrix sp.]
MPNQNVLGKVGAGFATAMQTLDIGRCGLGASSLGSAKEAYDLSVRYAIERQCTGRAHRRFSSHSVQACRYGREDLRRGTDGLRLCQEGRSRRKMPRSSRSIVKLFCTEAASQVIDEAIQIHGGMGFSRELPLDAM